MFADFVPKLLAEGDDVVGRRGFAGNLLFHVREPHVIEEREPREFPDSLLLYLLIGSKVDRAREDAFKPVDEPIR
jgi:hypothetical protein